jgi:hypothetical protein
MNPIDRLKTVKILISESIFCLQYSHSIDNEEKEKFHRLGISVLENMTNQLDEIYSELLNDPN